MIFAIGFAGGGMRAGKRPAIISVMNAGRCSLNFLAMRELSQLRHRRAPISSD